MNPPATLATARLRLRRPVIADAYSSSVLPSGAMRRKDVALYQTEAMSMRASVPMIEAVFGPAERDPEIEVDRAPEACDMIVATSESAPVSPSRADAVMASGSSRMSHANEIG